MVTKEFHSQRSDGTILFKSYSTEGYLIKKIGTEEIYAEAIDIENSNFSYEETDIKIDEDDVNEVDSKEATIKDYQNALGELGVEVNSD